MDLMASARYFKDYRLPSEFSDSDNEHSADGIPRRRSDHTRGSRGHCKQKRRHEGSVGDGSKAADIRGAEKGSTRTNLQSHKNVMPLIVSTPDATESTS